MTEAKEKPEKTKRFRSPPYPAFDLEKAVERAALLQSRAHQFEVGVTVLTEAWNMDSATGKVWRNAAALLQYALLKDSGSGKSRKFQITDLARRLIQDTDPNSEKRKEALKTAALTPMIHKELWDKYGPAAGLSDSVIKTYLTIDRSENGEAHYSTSAAEEVTKIYRATLDYAGVLETSVVTQQLRDKIKSKEHEEVGEDANFDVKVGDFVLWTSAGIDQFSQPRQVEWVSEDGSHVRVFGSPTGINAAEIQIAKPPTQNVRKPPPVDNTSDPDTLPFTVYQIGKRLQITADVDEKGLIKLKELLDKYQEILKLLN